MTYCFGNGKHTKELKCKCETRFTCRYCLQKAIPLGLPQGITNEEQTRQAIHENNRPR